FPCPDKGRHWCGARSAKARCRHWRSGISPWATSSCSRETTPQRYHHALMDAARDTSDGDQRTRRGGGAILVLPTTLTGERGHVAAGVSTAGWAGGFGRALGEAWIVTPSGVIDADELRRRASNASL